MKSYENKLALITGGSEGIGKSIAIELASQKCRLILLARDSEKLRLAANEIKAAFPTISIETVSCDLTKEDDITEKLKRFSEPHSCPDIVINCAGFAHPGYLDELPFSVVRSMMELNYYGTARVVQILLPAMKARGAGIIINTSSIAGFVGLFGYTGYCASKYAVIGFSEALRQELRPFGIQVSVLCPPNTHTPGLARENLCKPRELLAAEEKVKSMRPEQVARALIQGLSRNKFMIVPSFDGKLAHFLQRHLPWTISRILRRPPLRASLTTLPLILSTLLGCATATIFSGCKTTAPESLSDPKKIVDSKNLQVYPQLELISVMQLSQKRSQRFDLSGLVSVKDRIFSIADNQDTQDIFEIGFRDTVWDIKSRGKLLPGPSSDIEGLDYCKGHFYFIDEASNNFYRYDPKTKKSTVILVDWDQINETPQKWKSGAGLEGVAIDCPRMIAYLIKEREPRLIVRFDMNTLQTVESFNFLENDGMDYTDAKFENGHLYLLERSAFLISKVDPDSKAVKAKYSFRHVAGNNLGKLFEPAQYAMEEALTFHKDEIWIGTDNNGVSSSQYGQKVYKLKGIQPSIMRFKRPKDF